MNAVSQFFLIVVSFQAASASCFVTETDIMYPKLINFCGIVN